MTTYRGSGSAGSGGLVSITADSVSITDTGLHYTATNVEDALAEIYLDFTGVYSSTQTFTNKTINLANNTITGTMAEFDAACSDGNFSYDGHIHAASVITVADAGGYFTSANVEGALQEVGAAGVRYFTGARNTTAPNATVPVHSWTVTGAETNIDAALSPKGTGSLLVQIPDGTATAGDKRGAGAVDLQKLRSISTMVASGDYSIVLGSYNTASGSSASSIGGINNSATAISSVTCGGQSNVVSGQYSGVFSGSGNSVSGNYSFSVGSANTVSGAYSFSTGLSNNVSGGLSSAKGQYATDRGLTRHVIASGRFSVLGDAQAAKSTQRMNTSDATPSILTTNGAAATSSNVSVLPDNHAYTVTATITARDTATGDMASWKIEGAVKRGANAAATALVGTPAITTIAQEAGASTWAVAMVANTTRGSVEIQVTGEAATTIHWVCKLDTVEVG